MNSPTQMKKLMEAVDKVKPIKVDQPKKQYANHPNEQTLDSRTMNDIGNDLNRKKNAQFRSKEGDNPMAMTPVKVKQVQERLARQWKNSELKEARKVARHDKMFNVIVNFANKIFKETRQLMRKNRMINESIEEGVIDVVNQRLNKTLSMIEDLSYELSLDEGAAVATVRALNEVAEKLEDASNAIESLRASLNQPVDMDGPVDYDKL